MIPQLTNRGWNHNPTTDVLVAVAGKPDERDGSMAEAEQMNRIGGGQDTHGTHMPHAAAGGRTNLLVQNPYERRPPPILHWPLSPLERPHADWEPARPSRARGTSPLGIAAGPFEAGPAVASEAVAWGDRVIRPGHGVTAKSP
jgi:hypothetical protein